MPRQSSTTSSSAKLTSRHAGIGLAMRIAIKQPERMVIREL